MNPLLDAAQTAAALPWEGLIAELRALLADPSVQVPARIVMPMPGGASLFVMPACDAATAMTKLITFTPANLDAGRPTIQGDVTVFDVPTGRRLLWLDGPSVTARRTAAVSALAARVMAVRPQGPMLVIGAGVQGTAHLEAFASALGVREFRIASRSPASAERLVRHAQALGCRAEMAADVAAEIARCPLIATCTPADRIVLDVLPRADAFVVAVGAFTPHMAELSPAVCQHLAAHGRIVLDTPDARHEAGDLLQAGLDLGPFATLADVLGSGNSSSNGAPGPVLFKSCGWAGWDLAAARLARRAAG